MYHLNEFDLAGNIGSAEFTPSTEAQKARLNFSIAERLVPKKDQETGEYLDQEPIWHSVTAFGDTAEGINSMINDVKSVLVTVKLDYYTLEKEGVSNLAPSLRIVSRRDFSITAWKDNDERSGTCSLIRNRGRLSGYLGSAKLSTENDKRRLQVSISERIYLGENEEKTIWHRFNVYDDETIEALQSKLKGAKAIMVEPSLRYYKKVISPETQVKLLSMTLYHHAQIKVLERKPVEETSKQSKAG